MPTQPQIARLYALASRVGLSHQEVLAELARRYGLQSSKDLTAHQYEAFTHDLSRFKAAQSDVDIAPATATGRITSVGGFLMALAELSVAGYWFLAATDTDDATAAELLECFRKYRPSHSSLSPMQVKRIVSAWQQPPYNLVAWREAAGRYLSQHRDKDERYFLGILKRVAHELGLKAPRGAAANPRGAAVSAAAVADTTRGVVTPPCPCGEGGPGGLGAVPFRNNGHSLGTRSSHTADLHNAIR